LPEHECFTLDADPANPEFVASYLRVARGEGGRPADLECSFIETNTAHSLPILLAALDAHRLPREAVRYVIVTHAHLDHAGGAGAVMEACPHATLIAHPRAARHLIDPSRLVASATQVYGAERFKALYGVIAPIPKERVQALEDNAELPLGRATLRFVHTRGHAKHHFVVHDPALDTVFTGDSFGLVYPRLQRAGLFTLASTSPTDFEPEEARQSVARILALGAASARLTHYGETRELRGVATQLLRAIDQSEQWLDAAVRSSATAVEIHEQVRGQIREALAAQAREVGLTLEAADWDSLALDIDLNAQGIAFVADRLRSGASVNA
jgi:glyoxylase-like metal-dependent hydrolase (beta-lactamase superfamily II)